VTTGGFDLPTQQSEIMCSTGHQLPEVCCPCTHRNTTFDSIVSIFHNLSTTWVEKPTYNRVKGSVPVSGQQSSMEEADNQ